LFFCCLHCISAFSKYYILFETKIRGYGINVHETKSQYIQGKIYQMNNAFIVVLHLVVLFDLMFLRYFFYIKLSLFSFILISLLIFCYFHNLFFITLFESLKHMIDK
jgi:uncharacterized membrane protein